MLWKTYFEQGYGITSYAKIFIYLIGFNAVVNDPNLNFVFLIGVLYGISCFVIGWAWFRYELFEYQAEVGNQFNPFVKETRKFIKNGNRR